ncbi:S8 family serine peptidase [Thiohalobacter thiocyanaticus]|uniref:Peptidase S8 n=1 Tax=Thiohalobacter thiocyanaticus TaxID=585455 RepID=A0A426QIG9_9GAMM|nr:S8 family serine peptidase [Thiohalobacter thiocyanaticus]RRQ21549.1 peptidase S8 [Thiohalobacter thiocyanaticus]
MKPLLSHSIRAILSGSLFIVLSHTAQAAAPEPGFERLLVQPRIGTPPATLHRLLRAQSADVERVLNGIGVAVARVPEHALERVKTALTHNPHIQFVEVDRPLELATTVADDTYYSDAWHLDAVGAPLAWDHSFGNGMSVAVLDTGINAAHEDLKGKVLSGWNSADSSGDYSDVNGHGTRVAGVIGALSNNATGVTSVAWNAMILPVRVTNSGDGAAYLSDIANGLIWAADQGADIANISYNVSSSSTINNAAKYMRDRGGLVVAAAGNSGAEQNYEDSPYIISVSATNVSDSITSWSSYGAYVDVAAPGAGIYSTSHDGGYAKVSGTSFSSPLTAGILALMKTANPGLNPGGLESALKASAVDLGEAGYDVFYGHGRVDAAAAVQAAMDGVVDDSTPPSVVFASPADGSMVSGQVAVDIDASDDGGVDRVELLVNGAVVGTDSTAPYGFSWDSTTVSDGAATLVARAHDMAGNIGKHGIEVDVSNNSATGDPGDSMNPVVEILEPADGSRVSGMVKIQVRASDNKALSRISIAIDGSVACMSNTSPLKCNWNTRKAGQGLHTIQATAIDSSANSSTDSVTVEVASGGDDGGNGGGNGKGKQIAGSGDCCERPAGSEPAGCFCVNRMRVYPAARFRPLPPQRSIGDATMASTSSWVRCWAS